MQLEARQGDESVNDAEGTIHGIESIKMANDVFTRSSYQTSLQGRVIAVLGENLSNHHCIGYENNKLD